MADGDEAMPAELAVPTPGEEELDRALMAELRPGRPLLFADDAQSRRAR